MKCIEKFSIQILIAPCLSIFIWLSMGCSETFPDITNDVSNLPQPDSNSNDTFFNADTLTTAVVTDTLGVSDQQDYYKIFSSYETRYNGTITISLTALSGDADLELFDHNLNLISWSRTDGLDDEVIEYWYDATQNSDLDSLGLHFIRISNADGDNLDYSLSFTFD